MKFASGMIPIAIFNKSPSGDAKTRRQQIQAKLLLIYFSYWANLSMRYYLFQFNQNENFV